PPRPAGVPAPPPRRPRSRPPGPAGRWAPPARRPPPAGSPRPRCAGAAPALPLPLAGEPAEAPFPPLEGLDRRRQVLPAEVGPADLGNPELRIRQLPE